MTLMACQLAQVSVNVTEQEDDAILNSKWRLVDGERGFSLQVSMLVRDEFPQGLHEV